MIIGCHQRGGGVITLFRYDSVHGDVGQELEGELAGQGVDAGVVQCNAHIHTACV